MPTRPHPTYITHITLVKNKRVSIWLKCKNHSNTIANQHCKIKTQDNHLSSKLPGNIDR